MALLRRSPGSPDEEQFAPSARPAQPHTDSLNLDCQPPSEVFASGPEISEPVKSLRASSDPLIDVPGPAASHHETWMRVAEASYEASSHYEDIAAGIEYAVDREFGILWAAVSRDEATYQQTTDACGAADVAAIVSGDASTLYSRRCRVQCHIRGTNDSCKDTQASWAD